ncbi:MAG: hypothetical protein ED556_12875 [Winogradskyella sp.]|uniref:hypothetical protein n=1 Tax=Winogradskyella sp. TaxID=1883156 RepID=UPI000F3EC626|nr:hypothetical protein [Winogradskyella sp.]RNC83444.1 MAG: hypothetical protein ED556_12875 [Winogradskyella sp.]
MKSIIAMKNNFNRIILGIFLTTVIVSCEDGLNDLGELEGVQATSGFVVVATTASNNAVVKYFNDIPSGTVTLNDGFTFQRFFPNSCVDGALFLQRPDGFPGFSKYIVGENGGLFEAGSIPTLGSSSFRIDAKDSDFGVYQDRATSDNITVFNPTTLEVLGTIDMTQGEVPGDLAQRYQRFIFRGDDLFAPIRGNQNGEAFNTLVVHSANVVTQSYTGTTERIGNGFADINTFNNFGQNLTDTAGNLYIADAGNYTGLGVAAAVSRVPVGSDDIDPNYSFQPAVVLNPFNVFLPTFNGFKLLPNGKAIARVNAETPQAAVDIILSVGGNLGLLSQEQIDQIFNILFTSESAVWCVLDLDAQTVTPLFGIPRTGVFAASDTFFHDGGVYVPVATQAENGYYRYDWTTNQTSQAFQVMGADISQVINIANDN